MLLKHLDQKIADQKIAGDVRVNKQILFPNWLDFNTETLQFGFGIQNNNASLCQHAAC